MGFIMKELNNSTLAKGIFYNKKTKLCIFEINNDKIKWYNLHIDKIEGKFYQGCSAKLYKYDEEILKAEIIEPGKKKKKEKNKYLMFIII